jgi:hypothetical protein
MPRMTGFAASVDIEQKVQERIKNKVLPESKVEMNFERRRLPLEPIPGSKALGAHAQNSYRDRAVSEPSGPRGGVLCG